MRIVVVGAGAIGGVVGGLLFRAGHEVVLVARGAHLDALAANGLRLESPDGAETLPVPAVGSVVEAGVGSADAVLLCVKSQDTAGVVADLAASSGAPPDVPVVCMQNGVENERVALRAFARVYGVAVMCPTTHLQPGVVQAHSAPTPGILDLGQWPAGVDEVAEGLADALRGAGFDSVARPDIARWKWAKLLTNLGNAIESVCGPPARGGPIDDLARAEGEACLAAAGIDYASAEEDAARRAGVLRLLPVGGRERGGGSSWQSIVRGTGAVETDYLNGEIVLLGRLHGVPTPVNELLQRLANELARARGAPGAVSEEDFLARLRRSG